MVAGRRQLPEAFRVSSELAQIEVLTPQGPLREIIVRIEWASNALEDFARWFFVTWAGTPQRFRKVFSHYGAICAEATVFSGYDPGNWVYAFSLTRLSDKALTPNEYQWSVSSRSLVNLGDLVESLLGYAWWLRHRPYDGDFASFSVTLRAELPFTTEQDIHCAWLVWQQQFAVGHWAGWLERLVVACEMLLGQRAEAFALRANWDIPYEVLRLNRPALPA